MSWSVIFKFKKEKEKAHKQKIPLHFRVFPFYWRHSVMRFTTPPNGAHFLFVILIWCIFFYCKLSSWGGSQQVTLHFRTIAFIVFLIQLLASPDRYTLMRFDVLDRTRSATKSPLPPNRFFSFYFIFLMPQVNENAKIKNKNKERMSCHLHIQ